MIDISFTSPFLWLLTLLGLAVSILSALENRVAWIDAFCGFFGEGCRRTADFTLFGLPIAWWGIGYYLLLGAVLLAVKPLLFWVIMAGVGVELTFLKVMALIRAFCIFCLFNAVVVVLLFAATFDPGRFWEALSAALLVFVIADTLISRENRPKMTPSPEPRKPDLLAELDGEAITAETVEKPLAGRIYDLKSRIYRLKRDRLEEVLRQRLFRKEADRKGISVGELEASVRSDSPEEEADAALNRYAETLKDRWDVIIHLEEPALPFTVVSLEKSPILGPADAPVTIIEFSDYLCPACRQAHKITRTIRDTYEGKVRWAFKDFPLKEHEGADILAMAARCAGDQGQFWAYQDKLFSAGGKPDADTLERFASELGLDTRLFRQCLENETHRSQVEKDAEEAKEAGVHATPSFIINGRLKTGALAVKEFEEIIGEELARAGA